MWPAKVDQYISAEILKGKVWDSDVMTQMVEVLEGAPPGIVVDAGANIGSFTLVAAVLGHTGLGPPRT